MSKQKILGIVGITIVICIGGYTYLKPLFRGLPRNGENSRGGQGMQFGGNARGDIGGMYIGTITDIDEEIFTFKLENGSSKIVIVPQSAEVKDGESDSTRSEISINKTVRILGSTNSDGSIVAKLIQLDIDATPSGRMRMQRILP